MTGEELLRTHRPVVKYDSQESYFADSAATFTDSPGNRLRRAAGAVNQPTLNLAFLGKAKYADGKPAAATDKIGDPNPKEGYRERARKMHEKPGYANRVYGRVGTDRNGEQWLQYWLFYYYNDYNLIGGFLKAGLHEGDWEGIQIRVRDGKPDVAVFAQHANAQARDWRQVDIAAGTKRPIVYVARGSHASYFEPGTQWTGHWFDHADGKRRSPELTLEIVDESDPAWSWISWPGRWGDTKKGDSPLDTPSPDGPGAKKHWKDPLILAEKADETLAEVRPRRPSLPSPPHVIATRAGDSLRLEYETVAPPDGPAPTALTVTINSPDESAPPTTETIEVGETRGTVEIEGLEPGHAYDVYISAANTEGLASTSVRRDIPAE